MRVIVEVATSDLAEMQVTAEQLEASVRNQFGSLNVEGDPLYINQMDVVVTVVEN